MRSLSTKLEMFIDKIYTILFFWCIEIIFLLLISVKFPLLILPLFLILVTSYLVMNNNDNIILFNLLLMLIVVSKILILLKLYNLISVILGLSILNQIYFLNYSLRLE